MAHDINLIQLDLSVAHDYHLLAEITAGAELSTIPLDILTGSRIVLDIPSIRQAAASARVRTPVVVLHVLALIDPIEGFGLIIATVRAPQPTYCQLIPQRAHAGVGSGS